MKVRIAAPAALLLLATWVGVSSGGAVRAAGETGETIHAFAINMRGGPGPNTGQLIVHLERYSAPEEVAHFVEAFKAGGQDAVVRLWQKERPVVGRVRFAQTLGYDLRMARTFPTEGGGRRIRLITDRPIAYGEVMRGLRSEDYPIGWIELEIDAEGKGEGKMFPAAEVKVEDGSLTIESFGINPVRLNNVKVTAKDK